MAGRGTRGTAMPRLPKPLMHSPVLWWQVLGCATKTPRHQDTDETVMCHIYVLSHVLFNSHSRNCLSSVWYMLLDYSPCVRNSVSLPGEGSTIKFQGILLNCTDGSTWLQMGKTNMAAVWTALSRFSDHDI